MVPALKKVLEKERGNDIITGAMIALAKIGDSKEESGTSEFEQIIKQFLKDSNQEISETAAVALGILANPASVDILTQLLTDSEDARRLLGKTEVPWRTRAFAAYGLGLIGNRCGDPNVSKQIAATLVEVLNSPSFATRDIKVAAMTAYGLTPLESLTAEAPEGADLNALAAQTRQGQIAWLMDYLDEAKERANSRTRHYMVRAHVPTAMARLLADGNGEFEKERDAVLTMLVDVVDEHSKYNVSIQQSAILAMGQVADARKSSNKKSPHALAQAALERLTKDGDQQGRRYALIAMAQAAARTAPEKDAQGKDIEDPAGARDDMRKAIVSRMAKAKGEQRAWAGLALGVHGRALADASQGVLDSAALAALKTECEDCKTPSEAGAYMLGLGLLKDTSSAELILKKLDFFGGSDETRGHAAVAAGLMGYTQAKQRIQEILEGSAFRPEPCSSRRRWPSASWAQVDRSEPAEDARRSQRVAVVAGRHRQRPRHHR
ncbi:MAG: HEAT repeat domain-containing protein [Planctomycetota bacterium]